MKPKATTNANGTTKTVSRRDVLRYGASLAGVSALNGSGISDLAKIGHSIASSPVQTASKPNILFMLADNLGYGVPSCYNGGILDTPTPRIDKLASEATTID